MSVFTVLFKPLNIAASIEEGTTLLEAQRIAGLEPDAPCGGAGTCGKCVVDILEGYITGAHKACEIRVKSDMTVRTGAKARLSILTNTASGAAEIKPHILSADIDVDPCKIGDNRAEWERFTDAFTRVTGIRNIKPNLKIASRLYKLLGENANRVNAVYHNDEILDVRAKNEPIYVMAFDIGTTTIVGYLMDASTGEQKALSSMLNPQASYGADVIQRATYSIANGTGELAAKVRGGLNSLIKNACRDAGITSDKIYMISVVGNTCMHHLFLDVSPESLAKAPYNPAISSGLIVDAQSVGISINAGGKALVLPNIAGFVGADTVGCMLFADSAIEKELTLLIDIGTNGEMVLGTKDRRIACSTAAGPAFEGAKIACGMRGAEGAIDHASLSGADIIFSTIGGTKAAGICGSGLMDIISVFLEIGMISGSGRIAKSDSLSHPAALNNAYRLIQYDGKPAILLFDEKSSSTGKQIFLCQQDIREVQLAKAAIAAGIKLMADELKTKIADIRKVLIAGAFGNYMEPRSACAIGMLPCSLLERIVPVGNAAGEGARIALLSTDGFSVADRLAKETEFLELATRTDFQHCFVEQLNFDVE